VRHNNIPYVHAMRTSPHNSSNSTCDTVSADGSERCWSIQSPNSSGPATVGSRRWVFIRKKCRDATVYAHVVSFERPSNEPTWVTMRINASCVASAASSG
jgi:hypothetical protein